MVLFVTLAMAAVGIYNYSRLSIDAVPDITNVQVQINTAAPGYSPLETEQRVTYPIETVMAGLPGLEQTRSLSRYGLSQVTVIFNDSTNIYFARQLVNERLQQARENLPEGISATLGPISTSLGEIYFWTVEAEDGAQARRLALYLHRPARDPGLGGQAAAAQHSRRDGNQFHRRLRQEYLVAPNTEQLASYGLSLTDIMTALDRNNANIGAGYIERKGEQYLIRAPGQVQSVDDIGNVLLTAVNGQAIRVRDVAEVSIGRELRTGAATDNGRK